MNRSVKGAQGILVRNNLICNNICKWSSYCFYTSTEMPSIHLYNQIQCIVLFIREQFLLNLGFKWLSWSPALLFFYFGICWKTWLKLLNHFCLLNLFWALNVRWVLHTPVDQICWMTSSMDFWSNPAMQFTLIFFLV